VKGAAGARALVGAPVKVDVTSGGKRFGYRMWPVGVDIAKGELYGWLKLEPPLADAPYPPGFCHFPQYEEEFFKQLTAEHLVSRVDGKNFIHYEWQKIQGRENHWLDCRVYARAAASLKGLDRMRGAAPAQVPASSPRAPAPEVPRAPPPRASASAPRPKFLGSGGRGKSWLGR